MSSYKLTSYCLIFLVFPSLSSLVSIEALAKSKSGEFTKTAILGEDSRCPLEYGPQASEIEQMFYGVGLFINTTGTCRTPSNNFCQGTGHLLVDRDLVITAAHIFRDFKTKKSDSWRDFVFYIKVWIPEEMRKISSEAYEFRPYKIKNLYLGTESSFMGHGWDYAFVQLSSPVSEVVDGSPVPSRHWLQPLAFRNLNWKSFPNLAMSVGFHWDRDWIAQKNCSPFQLYDFEENHFFTYPAQRKHLLMHDGDMVENSSGSAITLLNEYGRPELVAIATGQVTSSDEGNFDSKSRFNFAVEAQSFYKEFFRFRQNKIKSNRGKTSANFDLNLPIY